MRINFHTLKFLLLTTFVLMSVSACSQPKPPAELDFTPVTVVIPAKISDDVLSITLPKCALDLYNQDKPVVNKLVANKAIITYDIYAYSGNTKNYFNCEKENPTGITERNYLQPIYPMADGQSIKSGYDYLAKFNTALGSRVIDERPFVQKRNVNASQEMLLINGMPKQTTPFEVLYIKYDGTFNRPPSFSYDILTIVQDKFYFEYEVLILVPENRHGHNLPDYNTDFAYKFRDVIQANQNVLDHPELIQGFVDNNERVVKFINDHSVMTKQAKN